MCLGRETLHTQLYTSKIVSIILEESSKRFYGIEAPSTDACTAGSSGNGSKKKKHIASPCIGKEGFRNEMNRNESYTCHFIFQFAELILRTIVPINKKSSKPKLRWTCSSLLKRGENPKRGNSSSGAAGAGRATRSDGHKSCPDAMAEASGSGSRPRRGEERTDDRPPLFAREDTNGTRYMRETGAMLMSLMQDEQNGVIVLPVKIEGQPNHVTIAESWLPYGIPFAVVIGLVLSNAVTNKETIIPTFKRMMKNIRKEDMSLDLEEALGRLRRICHGVSLAADNFTRRLFDRDTCLVQPVMERLAGTEQLKNAGAGMHNLYDAIAARGMSGTIGDYIGVPIPTDRSYLNRGSPLYSLRQGWWTEIFNLGMRSNPSGGLVLLLDTLEEMTMLLGIMLRQLAFCIRVYNYEYRNTSYRMSIVTVINDVINLYDGSTAAVAYTMPARAVAINCLTGIVALLDVIRCYFGNAAKDALVRSHKGLHGEGTQSQVYQSPFWDEFRRYDHEAQEWFGMGDLCHDMSFNVLGVERDEPAEIRRKNHNLQLWKIWMNNILGKQPDVVFEFGDGRNPPGDEVELPFGMKDPRPIVVPVLDYDLLGIRERAQNQALPGHQHLNRSHSLSQCQRLHQGKAT